MKTFNGIQTMNLRFCQVGTEGSSLRMSLLLGAFLWAHILEYISAD